LELQLSPAKYRSAKQEEPDITNFYGLNRQPKKSKGELQDMKNMSSEFPGCAYPRPPRSVYKTLSSGKALFACANGKLAWVDGTNFVYDGISKGTVSSMVPKSIVDFYGNIIIFPDKKIYNYNNDTFETMASTGTYPEEGAVPDMDMICVFENRVWGIKGSKCYVSRYNNHLDWTKFSVPKMNDDSIFIELPPERGSYKGLIPLENHMLFCTNNSTYEGYGNARNFMPQLISNSRGTLSGKSLVEVNGMVFMLSKDGVNVYTGSIPRPISYKLDEEYVSGVAGTDGRRYYLSLYNGIKYTLYVCDTELLGSEYSPWYKEDDINVIDFANVNGVLYALTANNQILRFNDSSSNEEVEWFVETDEMNYGYLGNTYSLRLKVETEMEQGSEIKVFMKVRNGQYELKDNYHYETVGLGHHITTIKVERATSVKLKIVGKGMAKILSIRREFIIGSDKE
jgi:hypothetical protein